MCLELKLLEELIKMVDEGLVENGVGSTLHLRLLLGGLLWVWVKINLDVKLRVVFVPCDPGERERERGEGSEERKKEETKK